jgi:hypothetical protein
MLCSPGGGCYQTRSSNNSEKSMNYHKCIFLPNLVTNSPDGLTPFMSVLPARKRIIQAQSIKPSNLSQCRTAG